jgi:hypothetical protein
MLYRASMQKSRSNEGHKCSVTTQSGEKSVGIHLIRMSRKIKRVVCEDKNNVGANGSSERLMLISSCLVCYRPLVSPMFRIEKKIKFQVEFIQYIV